MSAIQFEQKHAVAVITLNRPEVLNSINRAMALSIQDHLDSCEKDDAIRAIYITGKGRAFCSGQDLQEVTGAEKSTLNSIVREHYNPIIERLRNIPKPIVGAVNGVAAGAGANIALACDLCIAAESAVFIQAFSKIGLIPDSGGTYLLPRLIGWQRAAALMFLGDKVDAKTAHEIGMICRVFPDDTFAEASLEIALRLSDMPTKGIGLTKKALNSSMTAESLTAQLKVEEEFQTLAGETDDYKEGVAAFLAKRTPVFKGS